MADVAGARLDQPESGGPPGRVAFYDFDGTLVSGNVVTRYAWYARRHPNVAAAAWRFGKAVLLVPFWLILDALSRRQFNIVFFRQYRGLEEDWLRSQSSAIFDGLIRGEQFRYARERVALDKAAGYRTVLVTGGLDFAISGAAAYFGFDDMLANRLVFEGGVATGEVVRPLLAGEKKASALRAYAASRGFRMDEARAYSDSHSDLPMLRAVGNPVATNPAARLRRAAGANRWPILDLTQSPEPVGGSF